MIPIFIVLVSWMGFKERITLTQTIGIVISLTGLIFIIVHGDLSSLISVRFGKGDMWTISAGLSWALYSVLLRKCPMELNPISFLTVITSYSIHYTKLYDATGIAVFILLAVVGVNYAVLWGLLAFFLNYVPNIGSIRNNFV